MAIFPEGTAADVCFDRTVDFGILCISNRNLNLHFTSSDGVTVKCNLNPGNPNDGVGKVIDAAPSWIVFDGVNLTHKWGNVAHDSGINIRLTGGSQMTAMPSYRIGVSSDRTRVLGTCFEVLDDSVLMVKDYNKTGNILLGGNGTLVISNATVKVEVLGANGGDPYGGGRIRFLGESPRLEVSNKLSLSKDWGVGIGADFDFIVPAGGYARAPIECTGSATQLLAKEQSKNNRFNISPESPLFKDSTYGSWPVVNSPSAPISTDRIEFTTGRSLLSEAWIVETNAPASLTYVRANPAAVLEVTADPYEVGSGDYGFRRDLAEGESLTLSAPTPPEGSGLEIAGYRLYSIAADGTATEVAGSPFAGSTCDYVHGKSARRLVWQWRQPTVYVSPTGSDANGGTSPDEALATVQAGVDKYAYGKVVVAPGTYRSDKTVTVGHGVTVVGGGEKPSDVVLVGTQSADAAYAKDMNVLILTGEVAQVRNVRLTNGKGAFGSSGVRMSGGLLENCEVVECYRLNNTGNGGGIYLTGGTVRDCLVSNNCAKSSGGYGSWGNGIYMEGGLVENCRILDNEKPVNGKLQAYGNANYSTGGGGVCMKGGILRGCLVKGNTHTGKGSGVFASFGTVENCTIVENGFATSTGAGVFLGKANGADNLVDGHVLFRNNIVRGNFDSTGETNVAGNVEGCTVTANCTKPVLPVGERNIDVDPQFDADYGLGDSACVDGGVFLSWMEGAVDLAGRPRAPKGRPDIGCCERPPRSGFKLIIR